MEIIDQIIGIRESLNDLSTSLYEWKRALNEKPIKYERNELYAALAKAKLEYKTLRFNRINSFNKQVYADLEAIQKATDNALSNNGLVFFQEPRDEDGTTFLYSTLGHASGQEICCKNRLLIPASTGAKSENNRFGESLAYLKRQVAQALLGIVASNDEADNDDADTAEFMFNNESFRSIANDPTPAHVDHGVFTEKVTKDQLNELYMELQDYPIMTKTLLKGLEINQLADMPKAKYIPTITHIRKQKIALMNSPKKEW
jgi:hypothetical protein